VNVKIPEWVEKMPSAKRQLWLWQREFLEVLASISWFPSETFDMGRVLRWTKLKNTELRRVNQSFIDAAVSLRNELTSILAETI
jgi:hypothetical protein